MGGKEEEEEEALAGNIHQEVTYPVHVCMGRERERGGWEGSPVFPPQDEEDTITAIRKGRRWEGKTSRTTPPPPPRLFMGGAPQYSLSLSRSTGGSFRIGT